MPAFAPSGRGLGAYFGEMAFLEACSVEAFQRLATDLAAAGAPTWLLRACRAAACDEARHAEVVLAVARAFGFDGDVRVERGAAAARSLEALAIENAVEGDRETFGALVVTWLGELLPGATGRALRGVARDEARHARLSRLIEAWLERVLYDAARARVAAARQEAFASFRDGPPDEALRACGVDAPAQRTMKASLGRALFDGAFA